MINQPVIFEKLKLTKEKFFQAYLQLTAEEEKHVLLESGRTGKYSIAGIKPFAVLKADSDTLQVEQNGKIQVIEGRPLQAMENWMKRFSFPPQPGLPDFQGGAIGYIGYDYVQFLEELPQIAPDDLGFPQLYFLVFNEWAVFDHEEESLWIMVLNNEMAREKLAVLKKEWIQATEGTPTTDTLLTIEKADEPTSLSFTEEDFVSAVEKIQHYIKEGEVCQVNLTVRQSQGLSIPPIEVYKELRRLNPSPYMGYYHTPDFQIVSGSPELLIKKAGKHIGTRPIGGTRPRGKNETEDAAFEENLLTSEKDQAEHIMLVDLERNDLGKVCEFGSVQVDELMVIEKYSHVMHIVSHVSGELAEDKSAYDLIEAIIPGGSITGAPKVRTLEIIEELEPVKRGVYTGTLGWIGFNEDLHLNVIIRTMLVKDGACHVQAGAGIVIDSDPKSEYEESLNKAAALWRAKEEAEKRRASI